jgi:hypothetical protein
MVHKIASTSTKTGNPVLMRRNFIARLLQALQNLFECHRVFIALSPGNIVWFAFLHDRRFCSHGTAFISRVNDGMHDSRIDPPKPTHCDAAVQWRSRLKVVAMTGFHVSSTSRAAETRRHRIRTMKRDSYVAIVITRIENTNTIQKPRCAVHPSQSQND